MAILKVANIHHDASGFTRTQISTANTVTWYTSNQERVILDSNGTVRVVGTVNASSILLNGVRATDISNSYAVTVGAASNTYAVTVGAASNTYAVTVGAASNTLANTKLANTTTTLAGTLTITGDAIVGGNVSVSGIITNGGNAVTPVTGFKNRIINGNFDFWQRGTSVTGVGNGQYWADRWVSNRLGTTANVSQQVFTLGQTGVPGEPTYFHRSVVTSVAGAANYYRIDQLIESVRTFAGQTATLSFWAKADASKNMAVEFVQQFGTGGSPSSAVNAIGVTTCALTNAWKKFTITVNIPSISGKTLGTDNNDWLGIYFWFDAGSNFNSRTNSLGQQSGTYDIAQVQLEAGSVATPFEVRPVGTELALCQRYYQSLYFYEQGVATTYTYATHMRTTPTLTSSGAAVFATLNGFVLAAGISAIRNITASAEL